METRSFAEQPSSGRHQVDDQTEAIRVVGIKPETNLEKAMFWLGTVSEVELPVAERVNLANVYAALALHDAVRDVTVSMVKLRRTQENYTYRWGRFRKSK